MLMLNADYNSPPMLTESVAVARELSLIGYLVSREARQIGETSFPL